MINFELHDKPGAVDLFALEPAVGDTSPAGFGDARLGRVAANTCA